MLARRTNQFLSESCREGEGSETSKNSIEKSYRLEHETTMRLTRNEIKPANSRLNPFPAHNMLQFYVVD